ncbi:2-oxoacid:acceptor oxidoreductase subunit alpha [Dethiothermospora halolimnae]|uniref:2-oxoacid:acceptor oxidoreductase subunit alpha n=1 Tax=Dethiothermospora halolimnae TaxID=3114390 RepID=UPI003CCC0347
MYNILIGGQAGQGMDTLSILLEKILKRKGLYIFSNKDYMSRVRGGHNFIQIRFGTEPIHSHHPNLDVIIALNKDTVDLHKERLNDNGVIICDESLDIENPRVIKIPMNKLARDIGNAKVFGSVAMGACLKLFGLSFNKVKEVFDEKFEKETSNSNYKAFEKGYELLEQNFNIDENLTDNNLLINSNQAIALGALAGGLDFYSAYPMTPSTSIMTYLSQKQNDAKIVVEQAEDEIAAINMAIGGSYAGARSMTGTSGGGFSLMTEALGLAGVTETPLVVVDVQRPGPATGLPTRTEQSDLSFVLTASHGEMPRMVLAVRNPEDAFYQTVRALNIADKYQMLVIILNDQYMADVTQTVETFDLSKVTVDRYLSDVSDYEPFEYKRYEPSESGISKRIIPGKYENQVVLADSDEHNKYGHITESSEVRISMMDKRMKRLDLLKNEIQEPEYFGVDEPEILLVGWGSMYGPLKEATSLLNKENKKIGTLVFGDLYPLPTKLLNKYSDSVKTIVNVEQNYTGQLSKLIRQETGIGCDKSILKYDGRQLSGYEIYKKMKGEVL